MTYKILVEFREPDYFTKDQEEYFEMMKEKVIASKGKNFGPGFKLVAKKECCSSPNKYKNIISKSLQFYSCSNCGADLGDIT